MDMIEVFERLGEKWAVKPEILKDIYLMLKHDVRFFSTRNGGGMRYKAMENHIAKNYRIHTIGERQLRYLVICLNDCREKKK